jgi:hypothetical protein
MLSEFGVRTLIKRPCERNGFVLTYGNRAFEESLRSMQLLRDGESVSGKLECEIFTGKLSVLVAAYQLTDQFVLQHRAEVQRVEKHPMTTPRGGDLDEVDVHVVKMPIKMVGKEAVQQEIPLVEVFFWPVKDEDKVFTSIRSAYSAWRFLNDVPVPIYRKNRDLQIVFANKAYIDDVAPIALRNHRRYIRDMHDLCGLTDLDIFDTEDARKYREDDVEVLYGRDGLDRDEMHGGYLVRVLKQRLSGVDKGGDRVLKSEGLHGVYIRQRKKD